MSEVTVDAASVQDIGPLVASVIGLFQEDGGLVQEFLAWARRHHAAQASVSAYVANVGAQRFYARHGFAPASVTMRAPL